MSAKKTSAKKNPGAKRAAKKPGALVKHEQRAEAVRLAGRRRSFSAIDRLTPELRDRLFELQMSPDFTYSDMQTLLLLETTHERLRDELSKKLDAAHLHAYGVPRPRDGSGAGGSGGEKAKAVPGGKRERNKAYFALRREAYEWARGESARLGFDPPILISDDSLSRMRDREIRATCELRENIEIMKWLLDERGIGGVKALAEGALGLFTVQVTKAISGAKTTKDVLKLAPAMNVVSNGYRGACASEKNARQRDEFNRKALEQIRAAFGRKLKRRPDLMRQVSEELDAVEREVGA